MSARRWLKRSWCWAGLMLAHVVLFAQTGPPVPVLCYHGFTEDSTVASGKLTEQYANFGKMLRFLSEEGYGTYFPEELESGDHAGKKPIIVTFDDGRKEQLRAAEMMHAYAMRGIFFVIPSRISPDNNEYFSSSDLITLTQWGHQIGVHGFSHRSMVGSPEETGAVRDSSLNVLRQAVSPQKHFPSFAFPFGHYDTSIVSLTSQTYRFLHTVNPGYWDRRSKLLPRMLVTVDRPAGFFREYVRKSGAFKPSLVPITPDGGTGDIILFQITGDVSPDGLAIITVSSDLEGHHYSRNQAADFVSVQGKTLSFEIRRFLERFFQPVRSVLAYAFLTGDDFSYISSGQSHWVVK